LDEELQRRMDQIRGRHDTSEAESGGGA